MHGDVGRYRQRPAGRSRAPRLRGPPRPPRPLRPPRAPRAPRPPPRCGKAVTWLRCATRESARRGVPGIVTWCRGVPTRGTCHRPPRPRPRPRRQPRLRPRRQPRPRLLWRVPRDRGKRGWCAPSAPSPWGRQTARRCRARRVASTPGCPTPWRGSASYSARGLARWRPRLHAQPCVSRIELRLCKPALHVLEERKCD